MFIVTQGQVCLLTERESMRLHPVRLVRKDGELWSRVASVAPADKYVWSFAVLRSQYDPIVF
jgi:hypothetical protein